MYPELNDGRFGSGIGTTYDPRVLGPRAKKWLFVLLAVFVSTLGGLALGWLPPLLIVGAVLGVLGALVILQRPFLGLLIYTVIFFLRPGELYPILAPLRLERVVGVVALASLLVQQHTQQGSLSVDRSKLTLMLMFLLGCLIMSVPFSYWPTHSIDAVIEMIKILVFYFLVVHILNSQKRLRIFVLLMCALVAYIAASAFVDYLSGTRAFAQGIDRATGQTSAGGGANKLGTLIASTFPLFLLMAQLRALRFHRVWFVVGLGLFTLTLTITGSRGSLLAFLAGLAVLWWRSRHRVAYGLSTVLLLPVAFSLLPQQYQTRYSTMTSGELDESSQARIDGWKTGVNIILHRPLTGVGVDCFGVARAEAGYTAHGGKTYLVAHNVYLEVTAEVGIPAAFFFFGFIYLSLRTNRRTFGLLRSTQNSNRWAFERTVLDGFFVGTIALLVAGLVIDGLMLRTWYIYAGVTLSIARIYAAHADARSRTMASTLIPQRLGV